MDRPHQACCPYCLSLEGYVRGVTIDKDDQHTLTYRCEGCKRSWHGEPYMGEPVTRLLPEQRSFTKH